ncbi:unnamed protein product [Prorocentrum cordatum]|uniref:Uncharacterized protein n=1 Tax=Prorocentrum cordatum TaxID=2364126 RepID=A0ABN9TDM1_9DINO|nr:unnamed protein product [Polarella glacialis]
MVSTNPEGPRVSAGHRRTGNGLSLLLTRPGVTAIAPASQISEPLARAQNSRATCSRVMNPRGGVRKKPASDEPAVRLTGGRDGRVGSEAPANEGEGPASG